jgi:hypothetical protein
MIVAALTLTSVAEKRDALVSSDLVELSPDSPSHSLLTIYDIQKYIGFDNLQGAQFSPETNTLVLFGKRTGPFKPLSISYFDHLWAALHSTSPTLSLNRTARTRQEMEQWSKENKVRTLKIWDQADNVTDLGSWFFRQGGLSVPPGTSFQELATRVVKLGGLEKMFQGKEHIVVPPEIVPLLFDWNSISDVEVEGMPPRSLLAQKALKADQQLKSLVHNSDLKKKIPGYVTLPEWFRLHGGNQVEEEIPEIWIWIAPEQFTIKESTDGRAIQFVSSPVKFNLEKYIGSARENNSHSTAPHPLLSSYANLLTSHFDELAEQFPIFHEIRECLKVMAIANWIKQRGWQIDLAQAGGAEIDLPKQVPGIVQMEIGVKATSPIIERQTEHGRVKTIKLRIETEELIWPHGGVDLDMEGKVKVEPVASLPRLDFALGAKVESSEAKSTILVKWDPAGHRLVPFVWTGKANLGTDQIEAIAIVVNAPTSASGSNSALYQLRIAVGQAAAAKTTGNVALGSKPFDNIGNILANMPVAPAVSEPPQLVTPVEKPPTLRHCGAYQEACKIYVNLKSQEEEFRNQEHRLEQTLGEMKVSSEGAVVTPKFTAERKELERAVQTAKQQTAAVVSQEQQMDSFFIDMQEQPDQSLAPGTRRP